MNDSNSLLAASFRHQLKALLQSIPTAARKTGAWTTDSKQAVWEHLISLTTPVDTYEEQVLRLMILPVIHSGNPLPYGTAGLRIKLALGYGWKTFWSPADTLAWLHGRRLEDVILNRRMINRAVQLLRGVLTLSYLALETMARTPFYALPYMVTYQILVSIDHQSKEMIQETVVCTTSMPGAPNLQSRLDLEDAWISELRNKGRSPLIPEERTGLVCGESPGEIQILQYVSWRKNLLAGTSLRWITISFKLPRKAPGYPNMLLPKGACLNCRQRVARLVEYRTICGLHSRKTSLILADCFSTTPTPLLSTASSPQQMTITDTAIFLQFCASEA
jgi:hypothetical protein